MILLLLGGLLVVVGGLYLLQTRFLRAKAPAKVSRVAGRIALALGAALIVVGLAAVVA